MLDPKQEGQILINMNKFLNDYKKYNSDFKVTNEQLNENPKNIKFI